MSVSQPAVMFLVVQNTPVLVMCLVLSLCYAVLSLLVQVVLCRPSLALTDLTLSLHDTKKELASIKSVQQDFVRHSRLNRKVIQQEKDVAAKKCKLV